MQLKNNLYKIIRKEGVGPVVNYAIELIPSCVIYAAHFPGEPITPGVCIVQMGKELVEELLSEQRSTPCKLMITKVKNIMMNMNMSLIHMYGYLLKKQNY